VIAMDLPFAEIWLHDFEFISLPGERPDVVCLTARELRSGRTLRLWRDELGDEPPYRVDRDVLFVNFVANAECACHTALHWQLPANVLDLSPVFRNLVNGLRVPEGKGLLGALRYFHFDTISAKEKDAARDRIMRGWPFTPAEREWILTYCMSDVTALLALLPRLLRDMSARDLGVALFPGEFAAVCAGMEHRGVPVDGEIFTRLADAGTWRSIRDAMVPTIDAQYGVYVRDSDGDWTFNLERFAAYLDRESIVWPWRTKSGQLEIKDKTFQAMSKSWPQLEVLRQLRYARNKMRKIKLAVGSDFRNRTVLWSFVAKTSRTQPKAAKWIFSPAVWLRSLIKPEPGMAVAYIDYSSAEFMIAAVRSDGHCGPNNPMLDDYNSGDPYLSFAKRVGAVPACATKESHADTRDRYKVVVLATQYRIAAETLAVRAGVSTLEAQEMLRQHRTAYAQYWRWSDDWLQHSLQTGIMRTAMGWTCRTGILELNARSICNWPIQADGADILRIACIIATRRGVKLLAPVHDAVLIEAPIERIEGDAVLMQEIMRRASRIVFNATADGQHELRTDAKIFTYPQRFSDKRGVEIWNRVLALLGAERERVLPPDRAA
jgi:DNA polymerase I